MARDYYQRENLSKGLTNTVDHDLILISDLDEIPNLENLNFLIFKDEILIFEKKMFYYKFNLLYKNFKWFGTKGVKKKNFISPQWVRNIKPKKYSWWRLDTLLSKKYNNLLLVKMAAGTSLVLEVQKIQKKLLNFAHHYEYENSGLDVNDLNKLIKEKE